MGTPPLPNCKSLKTTILTSLTLLVSRSDIQLSRFFYGIGVLINAHILRGRIEELGITIREGIRDLKDEVREVNS